MKKLLLGLSIFIASIVLSAPTPQKGLYNFDTRFVKYNAGSAPTYISPIFFFGTATTTGGVATVNLTDDGTATGNALFTTVINVQANAIVNTSSAIAVPSVAGKLVSADNKTLTINVVVGRNLLALGNTAAFAADGTQVYFTMIAY